MPTKHKIKKKKLREKSVYQKVLKRRQKIREDNRLKKVLGKLSRETEKLSAPKTRLRKYKLELLAQQLKTIPENEEKVVDKSNL
jgi:hypothetical protein